MPAADSVLRSRTHSPELPVLTPVAVGFLVALSWPEPVQPRPAPTALEQAEPQESAPAFYDKMTPLVPARQAELRCRPARFRPGNRAQETLLAEWNTSLR